jgi:hypothetical protein
VFLKTVTLFYIHCGPAVASTDRRVYAAFALLKHNILNTPSWSSVAIELFDQKADIGRIYIKGYLYHISYPNVAEKDIPLSIHGHGSTFRGRRGGGGPHWTKSKNSVRLRPFLKIKFLIFFWFPALPNTELGGKTKK